MPTEYVLLWAAFIIALPGFREPLRPGKGEGCPTSTLTLFLSQARAASHPSQRLAGPHRKPGARLGAPDES